MSSFLRQQFGRAGCLALQEFGPLGLREGARDVENILVTTAAEINHDVLIGRHFAGALEAAGETVRRFQRGDNALGFHQQAEGFSDLVVGGRFGYDAALLRQVGQDRRHADVIEPGGDAVRVAELAYLSQQGRIVPESATDDEVTEAFSLLMKTEGIIPALESSHGLAGGFKRAREMSPDQHVVINLSGRGDKDIFNIARAFPQKEWTEFLQREATRSTELLAQKRGH